MVNFISMFLEFASFSQASTFETSEILPWLLPFFALSLAFTIILSIAIYVYTSWALMIIAKRTKTEPSWLAWIPIANFYLLSQIAGMHWWPILLLIGAMIPFIGFLFLIAFLVFLFIWYWKTFEKLHRPGWWILLALIPFAGPIIFLILLGITAWGNTRVSPNPAKAKKAKRK